MGRNPGDRAMIKDLVVNLTLEAARDPAADFAISIAAAFGAHVAGIAFAFDPVVTPAVLDGLSSTWVDVQRDESRAAAKAAIERFEAAAKREGLSAEHRLFETSLGDAIGLFGRIARRFDLSVVKQQEPDRPNGDDLIVEASLFQSGRPTVVVPYIQKTPLKLDRVLVAWDGSHGAARAIGDAMAFLRRAKAIDIVIVSDGRTKKDEVPGVEIGQHLARHGLAVEVRQLVAGDLDVADTILSYAADNAVDFMVMGGYGHSRLREFVLGGATRGILHTMTIPVLMAH
jgi:nucleotide-binding universal stress UspA family protein